MKSFCLLICTAVWAAGAFCDNATGEEPAEQGFRHLITLPLDYDPQQKNYPVQDVAFSPDGTMLAAASWEKTVRLYHVPMGHVAATFESELQYAFSVAFLSPDKPLAAGKWNKLLWETPQAKPAGFRLLAARENALAISPDGRFVAVGKYYDPYTLWDLTTGKLRHKFDPFAGVGRIDTGLYKPDVLALAFGDEGKALAAHVEFFDDELPQLDRIQVWDTASGKLKKCFVGQSCVSSPNGKTLAYGNAGKISLLDFKSLEILATVEAGVPQNPAAFSPDGAILAAIGEDNTLRIWDLSSRKQLAVLRGHRSDITSATFSPNGRLLASGSYDGSVRIWSAGTSAEKRTDTD